MSWRNGRAVENEWRPDDDSETTHISLSSGGAFRTFDAGYAMGIFAKESHENYLAEMDALKERVREKLKREGLRRL